MNIEYHISFHMPYIHQKMTSLGLYRARTCFSLIKEHRGDRCHMYRQCRHICVAVKFPRRVANKQQQQQQQQQKSTQRHACRPVSCWDSALLSYSTGCKTGVVIKLRLWSANHFFKNLASSAVHLPDKKYHIWLMCKSQWSKSFAGGSAWYVRMQWC